MKKIISFCLYGSKATYILGMKENIFLAKKHFDNWTVRIYYNDTVPEKYINEYKNLGAECILCENKGKNKMNWEGMFWRWYPLDDENVECWISRDADSRLSEREYKLVEEWLNSGKTLHSIRDHRCHMHCIMGGMFGINNKLFHSKYKFKRIEKILEDGYKKYKERPYNVDQEFLNDELWNILKDDYIAHVSNGGRITSDSDIKINSVNDFIGKQYRLNDFYEDKLKAIKGRKGCYWRKSNNPSVYWSDSSTNIQANIEFESEGEYFYHRSQNGYGQDWSNIHLLDGVEIKDKLTPKNNNPNNNSKKGMYWRTHHDSSVYWSDNNKLIKKTIKFNSETEYFKHREKHGYPRSWSDINMVSEYDIEEVINDVHLHKIRVVNYDNANSEYLPYKCDWNYANNKLIGNENIQPKTIFIKVEFIESFYNSYYKKIENNNKFIVISGGGDITTPNNIDERFNGLHLIQNNKKIITEMLNDKRLIAWYCENCDELLPKMRGIPTGIINNASLEKYYTKIHENPDDVNFENKINVLCCHRTRHWTKERLIVNKLCNNEWKSIVTFLQNINNNDFINTLSKYTFTLCVQGGGLDPSPKAFEAIIAGSIPIIKKSDGIYDAYKNLPVVFIDDWTSNSITEQKLKEWLEELRIYYEVPKLRQGILYKLSGNYWWSYINNKLYDDCISISNRDTKICFISANYGNYDSISFKNVTQTINTDFIYFTDNPKIENDNWIIDTTPYHHICKSPLDNDTYYNSLVNNKHTFNIAKYFKQAFKNIPRLKKYEVIVWLDGSIEITSDKISEYILNKIYKEKCITCKWREGLSDPLSREVTSSNIQRYTKGYWRGQNQPPQDIVKQYEYYLKDNYENNNNHIWLTCFIAFLQKDTFIDKFIDTWYYQTLKHTTQDQIGFAYTCFKENFVPYVIPDNEITGDPFMETNIYKRHGKHGVNPYSKNNYYKNVYILNNDVDKMNPVVNLLYSDLCGGLERFGLSISHNSKKEIIKENSIILIDNNIKIETINYFKDKLKSCLIFGWCCHENKDYNFDGLKFIYVTCHTNTPRNAAQIKLINEVNNYCPLYHRANEDPGLVGTFKRSVKYDWCYIGAPYKLDMIPNNDKYNGFKMASFHAKDYLNCDERKKIYLSSLVHLSFQGDLNIENGHVSQRIYEGMCYGCIVVTNSKFACEETNNIAIHVDNINDVEKIIEYYKTNPTEVIKKQKDGYQFIKEYGTNHYSIEKINKKSKELYNVDFINNIFFDFNPLVSIAISTYEANGKGHDLLTHNIEQILNQTYNNIEIVISDHSSDNKIKEVCDKYNNLRYPIKYIHNPEHKGNSSQNTNNAIKYCTGEYIKILFMDDYLCNEDAIKLIVDEFDKNKTKKWLVNSYMHTKNYKDFYTHHKPHFSHDIALCNRIGCPSCLTIHKSINNRFDENLKWFMDSELYYNIKKTHGDPIFLHTQDSTQPLMINLHHENQVTHICTTELSNKEKEYIKNKHTTKSLMELVDNNRTDKNTIHAFLPLYDSLFKKKKYTATNVLEVGLGQRGNCHCGSIKLWRDYFINATTWGIEFYDKSFVWEGILNDDKIKLYTSIDAYDEENVEKILLSTNIKFDILLDDGSHELEHMKQFVKLYHRLLKDDGILVIEDIPNIGWLNILSNEVPENLKKYIKTYDLRKEKNRFDDIVFTIDLS